MALMRAWWLLVLALGSLKAQVLGLPYFVQDQVSATSNTPQTLGANFWWVATDATNNTHVTNWMDRILGSVLTNGNSGYPSNLSDGIHFKLGTQANALTNSSAIPCNYKATVTFFLIMEFTNTGSFQGLVADQAGSGASILDTGVTLKPDWTVNSVTHLAATALAVSTVFDLVWVSSNSASSSLYCYTNGILESSFSASAIATNFATLGWANSEPFSGVIKEVAVWTNAVVSASDILKLHTYGTNLYGYSP